MSFRNLRWFSLLAGPLEWMDCWSKYHQLRNTGASFEEEQASHSIEPEYSTSTLGRGLRRSRIDVRQRKSLMKTQLEFKLSTAAWQW